MVRTSAPNSVGSQFVDENPGTSTTGTTVVAADMNMHQEELCGPVEKVGLTLSAADSDQLTKAVIGLSHVMGELVLTDVPQTPGVYFPVVDRSVDQDITTAHYPTLVPALRAIKASVKGVTDHSVTVSGSVITFPATGAADALLLLLENDAKVSNWFNVVPAQQASAAATADYSTAATKRCVNIAGTDYAISAVNPAGRTITVSGTPASGAQTASVYTYRIAGSTTSARLHKIAGMVGVVAGEADGEVVGGFRRMDRGQGHYHLISGGGGSPLSQVGSIPSMGASTYNGLESGVVFQPSTDTTNGTPRTGKTTDPRTIGQYAYTWAQVYVA